MYNVRPLHRPHEQKNTPHEKLFKMWYNKDYVYTPVKGYNGMLYNALYSLLSREHVVLLWDYYIIYDAYDPVKGYNGLR